MKLRKAIGATLKSERFCSLSIPHNASYTNGQRNDSSVVVVVWVIVVEAALTDVELDVVVFGMEVVEVVVKTDVVTVVIVGDGGGLTIEVVVDDEVVGSSSQASPIPSSSISF